MNAELGTLVPVIDDEDVVEGGRLSRANDWRHYGSQEEAGAVISLVSKAETSTETSFDVWRQMLVMHRDPVVMPGPVDAGWEEEVMYYYEAPVETVKARVLQLVLYLTSCARACLWCTAHEPTTFPPDTLQTVSRKIYALRSLLRRRTDQPAQPLLEFYYSLDKLERMSPMGARFLEAHAERLRDEVCKDCWFGHNVLSDQDLEDEDMVIGSPAWQGSGERVVHPDARG